MPLRSRETLYSEAASSRMIHSVPGALELIYIYYVYYIDYKL